MYVRAYAAPAMRIYASTFSASVDLVNRNPYLVNRESDLVNRESDLVNTRSDLVNRESNLVNRVDLVNCAFVVPIVLRFQLCILAQTAPHTPSVVCLDMLSFQLGTLLVCKVLIIPHMILEIRVVIMCQHCLL